MRRAVLAVLAPLALVAGCSESPADVRADYCDAVEERQARLSELLAGDRPDGLLDALPEFRELAEEAPRDVTDEWRVLIDALDDLDEALDDAGVDPAEYDAEDPPDGVTGPQRRAIGRAADRLFRADVAAAYDGVKQQAVDVCRTPLFR